MPHQVFAQNLFDKEHSLKFTYYLFDKGLHKNASIELERLNFQFPTDDSIQFLLLKSYRKSGDYVKGLKRANELFTDYNNIEQQAANEYFKLLALNNEIEKAEELISLNKSIDNSVRPAFKIHLSLLNKNWQNASDLYSCQTKNKHIACYKPLINEGLKIKYKKPFVAGTLSAVVPGTGKIYTGFWQDGVLSFLSIGVSSWQAYTGFDKDGSNSIYGWSFSALAGVLYLANIYGSAKSAKHINSFNEEKVLHKVQHCLDTD